MADDLCCVGTCCGPGSWCCERAGEHDHGEGRALTPEDWCGICGGRTVRFGMRVVCPTCAEAKARCDAYTARKWGPSSPEPEDDRCVNCGQPEAAHAARQGDAE